MSLRRVLAVRELTITITAALAVHPATSATRLALARIAESAVRMAPVSSAHLAAKLVPPGPQPAVLLLSRPTPAPDQPASDPEVLGLAA
jgi:hypothetical protein